MSGRSGFTHLRALDGLRGIAVAFVVLYHFAPNLLPAGFIGVDVFFVLSGFLIASLALAETDTKKSFGVRAFYGRRARRLLPAALAAIVGIILLAVILEPNHARAGLRGDSIAALFYVSNWWTIAQGNSYQTAFGTESPFNHFWSLAVEEQFYLVFPFLLVGLIGALRKFRRSEHLATALLIGAVVLGVASAVLMSMLYRPAHDPSRVYLGSDTRAFAILAGVAAACFFAKWPHVLRGQLVRIGLISLSCVGGAFLLWVAITANFRDEWLYRGGFVAVALAVVALILASASGGSPLDRAFHSRLLGTLGLVSYGLYLWHWPIKVFVDEQRTGLSGVSLFAVRCALAAAATALSFWFIERPFRHRRGVDAQPSRFTSSSLRIAGTLTAIVVVLFAVVWFLAAPQPTVITGQSNADAPILGPDQNAGAGLSVPLPIKILWEGDSIGWTLGGGELHFPQEPNYDTPFDPTEIVIWNKATYACPLMELPARSFGSIITTSRDCVNWADKWRANAAAFPADALSWTGSLFDTYDVQLNGNWVPFNSP